MITNLRRVFYKKVAEEVKASPIGVHAKRIKSLRSSLKSLRESGLATPGDEYETEVGISFAWMHVNYEITRIHGLAASLALRAARNQ